MDMATRHRRAVELWEARVGGIRDDQWRNATPCTEWSVRELVNHVVGEERWAVPLADGATVEQVGHRFDGDLLGAEPAAACHRAATEAVVAIERHSPTDRVHLSYGEEGLEEYVDQLVADHLVHGWDLAVATGGDSRLDPDLVEYVARWYAEREELYRSGGMVAPRVDRHGDPQTELLAAFGRDAGWTSPR